MTDSTPLSDSDGELVLQAQEGDLAAMEALFERHQSDIFLYLTRLLGERYAERLTLATFRSAWEALPGLQQPADFIPWLYRIATNIAYDTRYQGPGSRPWPLTPPANEPAGEDPVAHALYRLAFYDRTSLLLHVVAGFTLAQVASCLGLSLHRVQIHLGTATQRLISDPVINAREEADVARLIKALPSPRVRLASPFNSDRTMDEGMLSLRRLSTSTSYTRPPHQRMLLRHILTSTSLLLVFCLVASGLLLLFANRGQLLGSMNRVQTTATPTAYDARVDRPLCFFVDPVYDNNSNGGSICNSHLYRDINQQQHAQGGYTLQLQQAYIDNNAFAMAYTLIGPANSTLDVSVNLNATLSIQGASTSLLIGRKYAASSTFFGQHNAISDASYYYLPQTALPSSIGNDDVLNLMLEVRSLWLTNQSSGKTLAIHWQGSAPLRYQFSLRESWGKTSRQNLPLAIRPIYSNVLSSLPV
ncbi:RNA polymerase sigma factor [Ktedonospora formicarum]|uniref:Uncharacterized protein n=1 Tax=Ktedonospora formicarum TaxID=2778364 RepID=A0A8J3HZD8_9CHLR|nr:RNA polymerase sigma factor [Ktedonospora formicarum]GHO43308.1 hypothetical protein KSX_14710 [Ktedonospora formicarum]